MHILLTYASSPAALSLARVLHSQGHIVIGADYEPIWGTAPARYSRAYKSFHRIRTSSSDLWPNVKSDIDLVIPFGDGDALTLTKFGARDVPAIYYYHPIFESAKEFQRFVNRKVDSVFARAPDEFLVRDKYEATRVLKHFDPHGEFEYSLSKASLPSPSLRPPSPSSYTSLSSPHSSDTLLNHSPPPSLSYLLAPIADSYETPHTIPDFPKAMYEMRELPTRDGTLYSAHCLISSSELRTLVVTTPADGPRLADYIIVSRNDPIWHILCMFVEDLIKALCAHAQESAQVKPDPFSKAVGYESSGQEAGFSMHLSITFDVRDIVPDDEIVREVTALSCSKVPHDSLIALCAASTNDQDRKNLALAYTDVVASGTEPVSLITPSKNLELKGTWSLQSTFLEFVHLLFDLVVGRHKLRTATGMLSLMLGIVIWVIEHKEEYWDWMDPGPALVKWFVRMPLDAVMGILKLEKFDWCTRAKMWRRTLWPWRLGPLESDGFVWPNGGD